MTTEQHTEAPTVHFCDELGGPSAEGVVGTGTTPCGEPLSGILGVRWSRDIDAVTCRTCRHAVGRS